MDLQSKLLDASQRVLLYGTTPPRAGMPPDQIDAAADKLAARLAGLPLDGVVVYDIQDETGRTASPRPFPYIGTVDPRRYAAQLKQRIGVQPRQILRAVPLGVSVGVHLYPLYWVRPGVLSLFNFRLTCRPSRMNSTADAMLAGVRSSQSLATPAIRLSLSTTFCM